MTKLEQLQQSVSDLSAEDLAAFSQWFATFKSSLSDAALETDPLTGALKDLASEAMADVAAGQSKPL